MEIAYQTKNGKLYHCDNLEGMKLIENNSVDSCVSDFPYAIEFMGKSWDSISHLHQANNKLNFYDWCCMRAEELYRIMKHGGYAAIFGHPKTNHKMKSAFEDSGFKIVEEIDWIYLTGMPKNQDIRKMFNKAEDSSLVTTPKCIIAKSWDGWKTSGLKPAHEPITIFQKPLDGTYINNISKYGCGAMNIEACRVPISQSDIEMLNKKASKNPNSNYSKNNNKIYGSYEKDIAVPANEIGRFPANIILDEYMAQVLDEQTGIRLVGKGNGNADNGETPKGVTPLRRGKLISRNDIGGGSRMFTIIKYCPKVSPSERKLPNGERNPHVTLKPIELIKWLIKLLTPINGLTIDITAGSGTHSVACEELNLKDGYSLSWVNMELQNTDEEPYVKSAIQRLSIY